MESIQETTLIDPFILKLQHHIGEKDIIAQDFLLGYTLATLDTTNIAPLQDALGSLWKNFLDELVKDEAFKQEVIALNEAIEKE